MATNVSIERPLPHNLEAERSILGAVLLDNHALNAAVERLRSEDFFLPQHRHIFERMVQLGEKQQAIDTITLMEDLARSGALEAARDECGSLRAHREGKGHSAEPDLFRVRDSGASAGGRRRCGCDSRSRGVN